MEVLGEIFSSDRGVRWFSYLRVGNIFYLLFDILLVFIVRGRGVLWEGFCL